jgi:pimeloyl-ACP methyl ester carboxylesterase
MDRAVRDVNVHYEEAGSGRPLLILHAWLGDGLTTMPEFEPFFVDRPGWRRIYPDVAGIVKTPVPDWLRGPDDLLDVLIEFMEAVAPGQLFAVAGVSWGAYFAAGLVHHRSDQVDGVLLSIPRLEPRDAYPNRQIPARQVLRHDPEMLAALQPGEEWVLEYLVVQSPAALNLIRQAVWPAPYDPAAGPLLSATAFSFDPTALPDPCLAPALVLLGHQDDVVGYRKGWSMIDQYPRGTFVVLDAAGHLLDVEQPALRHALIGNWLDRVEQYSAERALA